MKKLMIIDGNSIVNRAFYGIRPLTNKEGLPTHAIYGFLNIFLKMKEELQPDYMTVAFDVSRKTFRNELYEDYKATRKGMPNELAVQLPVLKEVLKALNISYIEKEGYEADDLIGTVSAFCEQENIRCDIVTGDRDDLQLSSKLTTVMLITSKGGKTLTTPFDEKAVVAQYGISPSALIDLKGLMGDSSDNIPGVKGVGEVTALKLMKEFGSIEKIYEQIQSDQIKPALRQKLLADREMAFLSRELGTIDRQVPYPLSLEDFKVQSPNEEETVALFSRLEFHSLLKRLDFKEEAEPEKASLEIAFSQDFSLLSQETDSFYYLLVGEEIFIPLGEKVLRGVLTEQLEVLKPLLENPEIKKYSYGIREQIVLLNALGVSYQNAAFDVKLAAYVLDPSVSDYRLASIVYSVFGESLKEEFEAAPLLLELCEKLNDQLLSLQLDRLFYQIEMPVLPILATMQIRGIGVDTEQLQALGDQFALQLEALTQAIYELSGEEFNINSPKQLSGVLFDRLGLKPGKKTKTGFSTDNAVLDSLKEAHPVVPLLMEYRTYAKLKSTYIDSLLDLCDENGILHSRFHQTVTQTGRLSSSDPNLQNIPIRLELGRKIRRVFVPVKKGNLFISADYSQIELRVLAQICGDENLILAFQNQEDIHTQAASNIFGVPPDEVTARMRSDAKTVNFAILYGKTEFTLAKDLSITRKEAKDIIDTYLNKYPNIRNYMTTIVEFAKENGYVKTLLGRIRFIRELSDRNYMVRQLGERIALNTPIQGTAADMMKIAMVNTRRRLKEEGLSTQIVLQIHDELVLEAPPEEADRASVILKESMEQALRLNVPLTVSLSRGQNLYELQ